MHYANNRLGNIRRHDALSVNNIVLLFFEDTVHKARNGCCSLLRRQNRRTWAKRLAALNTLRVTQAICSATCLRKKINETAWENHTRRATRAREFGQRDTRNKDNKAIVYVSMKTLCSKSRNLTEFCRPLAGEGDTPSSKTLRSRWQPRCRWHT